MAENRPRRLQFWCPGGTYFGELTATVATDQEFSRSCRNPRCRVAGRVTVHHWQLSDPRRCRTTDEAITSNEQVRSLLQG